MPPEAIRQSATIVLLRAGTSAPEILMLRRSDASRNFAGAHVFPGGALDVADGEPLALGRIKGLEAPAANARMQGGAGALAYWVAAVRECYEEAGILLARDAHGRYPDAARLRSLEAARAALNDGSLGFGEFLVREELWIAADEIGYFDRWIAPGGRAVRFDTHFFIAAAPAAQVPRCDGSEATECTWITATQALERAARGEMKLRGATDTILEGLRRFDSIESALAHPREPGPVMANLPRYAQTAAGRRKLHLRTDAAYDEIAWTDPSETGATHCELIAGEPCVLDRWTRRVLAPNAGMMTGPGTNSYLVGTTDLALIDPGPDDIVHIEALLRAAGGRLRWILLTHTHVDHSPAVDAVRQATGAQVCGRHALHASSHDHGVTLDRELEDGDSIGLGDCRLTALHTPGHASNHVCYLLEPTRMLFSGDHVLKGMTPVIAPPDGNLGQYLAALERLLTVDIAVIAPGHGHLVGEPQANLRALVAHRMRRHAKVLKALEQVGPDAGLDALMPLVYADVPAALHPMARLSLQAHLEYVAEERAAR
jgi:glyoxylase-like metal-dependent hydrolase (beta-lactamase superfamily II)/8-oxo-dGTP pyrophosphatase MutT (NUDIX family)